MTTIRLLSYNIRSMRDDRAALARVINRLEPDVVCVQEAPRFAFWLRKRRWLAREVSLGLAVRRRPAGLELYAGAGHGFAVPDNLSYSEAAAERHWRRLTALFAETLSPPGD